MKPLTAQKLIQKYLAFFKERGHAVIPSAPLVPHDDPSTLFITAGIQPFVPYFGGESHPQGKRLTSLQKCLRTEDLDGVGDPFKQTFFQMLGNWSLGDYFKREALSWSFEFITSELGIDPNTLHVTIFKGNQYAPYDKATEQIWLEIGIPKERIYPQGKEENWWEAGETGPGGPDSEIFVDTGQDPCGKNCQPNCPCGKYVEIWNNVFIEFMKQKNGTYKELPQKNIDTGMGVERTISILQQTKDNYKTELFAPIIAKIETLSAKKYSGKFIRSIRIIADHIRAAVFIIAEGVEPGKTDRGYVLRRLIRRAIREGKKLGIEKDFTAQLAKIVFEIYTPLFPELEQNRAQILKIIAEEEKTFRKTLTAGLKQFEKMACRVCGKTIGGKQAFDLYQSYGFPLELTEEIAKEKGLKVDTKSYLEEFKKHQEKSRTASKGHFKGGLADQCEETIKLHTATHLLNQALREILNKKDIAQKGSNITPERLRFDFSFDRKLTPAEIKKVEDLINRKIKENLPIYFKEMSPQKAEEMGAQAQFGHKYGKRVKVYIIGDEKDPFSIEICGGPHISSTQELGSFKIKKQESVGKGVRRIKATVEN